MPNYQGVKGRRGRLSSNKREPGRATAQKDCTSTANHIANFCVFPIQPNTQVPTCGPLKNVESRRGAGGQ